MKNPFKSFGKLICGLFLPKKVSDRNILEEEMITTPLQTALKNFFSNKLGIIGLLLFAAIFLTVFFGNIRHKGYDQFYRQPVIKNIEPGYGYLEIPDELKGNINDIQSGITYSVGLSNDGKIYMWGKDIEGTLNPPQNIKDKLNNEKFSLISSGDRHIIAVTESGEFIGWGNNSFNQINLPPERMSNILQEGIKDIKGGDQVSAILTNKGNLYVWGSVLANNLNRVPSDAKGRVAGFTLSSTNGALYTTDGEVMVFGARGGEVRESVPEDLKNGTYDIVDIALTVYSGLALDSEGRLHVWGSDLERTLNIPDMGEEKVIDISASRENFVALTESGKIYTWGSDNFREATDSPNDDGYNRIFADFFQLYAEKPDGDITAWGNKGFLIGTDELGRDMWIRLMQGGDITLKVSFIALVIQLVLGVLVGLIAGYYGGAVDNILMRFTELVASFPFYPLVISLGAMLPPETKTSTRLLMIMVILGILGWTGIARLVRGQILSEREKDYVMAAKALGIKEGVIMRKHILPNVVSLVIVNATIGYASNLLTEAGLSFLGFGVQPPYASWGNMLTNAQSTEVIQFFWWRWVFPAVSVFLTAFSINLVGDAMRDAIDPKSTER